MKKPKINWKLIHAIRKVAESCETPEQLHTALVYKNILMAEITREWRKDYKAPSGLGGLGMLLNHEKTPLTEIKEEIEALFTSLAYDLQKAKMDKDEKVSERKMLI